MIREKQWKWYGEAGHLIVGSWCRFHMTTEIGEYLVSTVGLYVPPHETGGSERRENAWLRKHPNGAELGYCRFYETMVFRVIGHCKDPECGCGMPEIDGSEIAFDGYNDRGSAREGHMKMCREVAAGRVEEAA